MTNFQFPGLLNFMLESGISLGGFALLYHLLLRKETFFNFNRFFLHATLIISLVIPFLEFSQTSLTTINLQEVFIGQQNDHLVKNQNSIETSFLNPWLLAYYAISIALFSIFLSRLSQIWLLLRQGKVLKTDGFNYVIHDHAYSAFSFFNLIFLPKEQVGRPENKIVIAHEQVHVLSRHSIDVIFLEVLIIVAWFNPFLWIYRQYFKENHEFTADKKASLSAPSQRDYATLLLGHSFGLFINDFTLSFNKLSIKKRITMMKKSNSGRFLMLKSLLAVPFVFIILLSFAFTGPSIEETPPMNQTADAYNLLLAIEPSLTASLSIPQEDKIYKSVKQMPKYPGGQTEMVNFLVKSIVYPETCKKEGIEGTVYVNFVIEKTGEVSNAKVLRGVNKLLDDEALRVVKLMPKWIPGEDKGKPVRVEFTMPIKFKLDKDDSKTQIVK